MPDTGARLSQATIPRMALIDCPECNGTVSDQAPACIHCGFPLANQAAVSEDDASISAPIPEAPTADPYVDLRHERDQIQADCDELMPDDPLGAATLAHQRRVELASNLRNEGEFTQDQYVEFKRSSHAESKRVRRRIETAAAAEKQRAEVAALKASVTNATATTSPPRSARGGWWRKRTAAEQAPWIVLLVLVSFFAIWLLANGLDSDGYADITITASFIDEVPGRDSPALLRVSGPADLTGLIDTATMTCRLPDRYSEPTDRAWQLRQMAPVFSSVCERLVLHASVAQTDAGVVGFIGESGAGKSTLARSLSGVGCRVAADDLMAVRFTSRRSRTLTLPGWIVPEMREQLAGVDGPLVFSAPAGGPLPVRRFSARYWKPATKAAGFPEVTPHQLRHLHATQLLELGRPITEVAVRLGHRSPRVTAEVYGRWNQPDDSAAAAVVPDYSTALHAVGS